VDIKVKLAYIIIDLVLPLVLGYLCKYHNRSYEGFFQKMIDSNICIIYPVLSVLTFWVLSLYYELIWFPVFGILLSLIPGAIAYLRVKSKYTDELDKGTYIICAMLSNVGTLGGLCAFILYGETGFAYTQLVVLLQTVITFMFCFPLAHYYYQKSVQQCQERQSLAAMFLNRTQLPVVGMAIGLLLSFADIPRPELAGQLVDPLVHLGAWTALLPIGYSIDFCQMRTCYTGILDLIPIKFIVTPIISYLLAMLVFTDEIARNTILILACMPTAINAVVAAKIHNLNLNIAMAAFVLTTVVFLLVEFPLLFLWLHLQ
jgi:predicted permease